MNIKDKEKKDYIQILIFKKYTSCKDKTLKNRLMRALGQVDIQKEEFFSLIEKEISNKEILKGSIYWTLKYIANIKCQEICIRRLKKNSSEKKQ